LKLKIVLVFAFAIAFAPLVLATELGVNYYHESMMSARWSVPYVQRTLSQAGQDFDDIKTVARHIKFYMNPFVTGNLQWVDQLSTLAKQKNMYTVINMMVDDRQMSDANWNDYANRVVSACQALNGKTDEILVGNELILHSSWSMYDVKTRIVDLIGRCDNVFNGVVSYEAFWYEKDAWIGYPGKLYFMHYENLNSFTTNVREMDSKFGDNVLIGEWGEDLLDGSVNMGDWWQKDQIQKRWDVIKQANVPVAYLFAYREAGWDDFAMIRPDGVKRPLWEVFTGQAPSPNTCISSTEVCDGKDNDCDNQVDENNVCAAPTPSGVSALSLSCTSSAGSCSKAADDSDSTCRYVTWNTPAGQIKATACSKPAGVEVYRNAFPSGTTFRACFGTICIDQLTGFAKQGTTCTPSTEICDSKDNNCNGQVDENNVCGTSGIVTSIAGLTRSCTANGQTCSVKSDALSGACRTLVFGTSNGDIKLFACDKGSGWVELYRQGGPGITYSACLASGCVTKDVGYVRFQPLTTSTPTTEPTPAPTPAALNVAGLAVTVSPNAPKVGDINEGSGRRVQFTANGWIEARICEKTDRYEMYLLSQPNGANVCVGSSCVGSASGFVSFK